MQVRLVAAAVLAAFGVATQAAEAFEIDTPEHAHIASVERYTVQIPASEQIAYTGKFASAFPQGLHPAFGSGLRFKGYGKDASLNFWAITDRGPNGDAPKVLNGDKKSPSKIFLAPDFAPRIGQINVQLAEAARLVSSMPLKQDGKAISGRPISPENTGSSKEIPLSDTLATLKFDDFGMDPEGIDFDSAGNLWISDEYGPFIAQVDAKSGEFMQQYLPGAGLPEVLGERQANRGMEGIALTPKGLVVGLIQSTLDIKKETKGSAQFIRLVVLDPKTGNTQMYAYPHDVKEYKKSGDAKMGDIVAIDETRFLIIEQGKDKNKQMRNVVYLIDIKGAQDLSKVKLANGKELEYADAKQLEAFKEGGEVSGSSNIVSAGASSSFKMVKKTRLFDLREIGWTAEKAEGLAVVGDLGKFGDATEIAVINDNDFGLKASINAKESDPEEYAVDKAGKLVDDKGNAVNAELRIAQGEERDTQLWMIHLKKPLKDYFPK
jgi:streptogramin lyase